MNKQLQKTVYCLLLSFCCAVIISPAHSQQVVSDEEGSADLDFLTRYRNSGIVRYQQSKSADFVFALARVRKSNNRWQAEQERRVYGVHTSVTYRAPDRVPSLRVFEHFRTQIKSAGFVDIFSCAERSCGGSNKWANVIYREKRLYGPDVNQHYLVADKGNETLSLYVIKRGNKRVYARIDHVVAQGQGSEAPINTSWSEQLQRSGRVSLRAYSGGLQEKSAELSQLVDWLSRSGKTLHVVGHAYGESGVSALKSRSLDAAIALRSRLIELGADAAQLEAHGLGPLAPGVDAGPKPEQDRLELLLID